MDKDKKIRSSILGALESLGIEAREIHLEHPVDLNMGDTSTNVAMVYAKEKGLNPRNSAERIVEKIRLPDEIEKVEVAGPGFINFYPSRDFFAKSIEEILNKGENIGKNNLLSGQKIMIEYTDPNPFKPFHVGHLMTNAIGESIARILEHSGAIVSRANYQGNIGLHVAKAIYGLLHDRKLQDKSISNTLQSVNIGKAYTQGSDLYANDEKAKKEIDEINKKIYDKSDEKINEIYDWGFEVTMEAFEDLYRTLGTKFDFYFLESLVAPTGANIVRDNLGKVFEESDGAIIFKGENFDPKLHTRVFITSAGLPTYETKELGLTEEKFKVEPDISLSIVITAKEQANYMKVVAKALSLIHPDYQNKMLHITHGLMRFSRNVSGKMSSRTGLIVTAYDLIESLKEKTGSDQIAVGAIKYMILRQAIGGDVIFDLEKSVSTEGDSGPYLQYSYARANSILEKAKKENILPDFEVLPDQSFEIEKLLYKFPEVVLRSSSEYAPHYITNYLIEIARAYNSFYGNIIIVKKEDETSSYKVALTYAFAFVMKKGLHLLGIAAPEKM